MICVHVNLHGLFFMKAYFNKELKKKLGEGSLHVQTSGIKL